MDPISGALQGAGQIASAVTGMIGAAQQRKLQKQAAELAQKGVGELQGGTGYDPTQGS